MPLYTHSHSLKNLVYGSMYNYDTSTTVTISGATTPTRIQAGFTAGQTRNTTFQNNRELVVNHAGIYLITWQISFSVVSGAGKEIEGFVMVDNVMNNEATAHRFIGTSTDTGSMSGTCILSLTAGQVISLGVLNETDTIDIIIEHANMSLEKISN